MSQSGIMLALTSRAFGRRLKVAPSHCGITKAKNALEIQKLKNQQNIDDAEINVRFAKLDLQKFQDSDAKLKWYRKMKDPNREYNTTQQIAQTHT